MRKHLVYCRAGFAAVFKQLPTTPTPKGRVDWENRDRDLVIKVIELMKVHKGKLTRSKLDKLLGSHGWMIKQKNKLPKTMKAYNDMKR